MYCHKFNRNQKKKKERERLGESVGIRAGYCVTEISPFQTQTTQWYAWAKKGRERLQGGPEEIMPPPLMPSECVQILEGGLSRGLD